MKVLRILVDIYSGEQLHVSTIEVDSDKFHSFTLPEEGMFQGEMIGIHYTDDFSPGPEVPDRDSDWMIGYSPEDFSGY